MKISIVTVFHSANCGSLMQATALQEVLRRRGCDVSFVSTGNRFSSLSAWAVARGIVKAAMGPRRSVLRAAKGILQTRAYVRNMFAVDGDAGESADLVVIGSDTVWNVDAPYFCESQDLFWGLRWHPGKVRVYAASIANSTIEKLEALSYPAQQLAAIPYVSVRDDRTQRFAEGCRGVPVARVCDPTFLVEPEFYTHFEEEIGGAPFMLLYVFNEPQGREADELRCYADAAGLRIVSLGPCSPRFADEHIEATVGSFLGCFRAAKCVVTDTFHGSAFSMIYQKQFVSLDRGKAKVGGLLDDFGTSDRLVGSFSQQAMDAPLNYGQINARIARLRVESMEYLDAMLGVG